VTQPRIPGLDPAIQERACLTDAQARALALWDPGRACHSAGDRIGDRLRRASLD
jgi:hypothetical protein